MAPMHRDLPRARTNPSLPRTRLQTQPPWTAALLAAGLALLAACGDEGEAAKPTPAAVAVDRTKQEPLDEAGWAKELAADPDLQALATATGLPLQAAGVVEDADGRRVVWGELAAGPLDDRHEIKTVFRVCDAAAACTRGTGSYTATGATLLDAAGKALDNLALGRPVLSKQLKNHNLDKGRTVLAPLERSHVVDPVLAKYQSDLGSYRKRRFLLLNAFGPQVGAGADEIRDAAVKTGLFDSIEVVDFARRRDVDQRLPGLSPLDVVVWLGAGVGDGDKPVGMTVSRGVFGDELYQRKMLDKLLAAPPLGGPGLVVLAGSNTVMGAYLLDKSSFPFNLHLAPHRPVVGFEGKLGFAQVQQAVAKLLAELGAGKDLGAALATAGKGLPAKLATPLDASKHATWRLPGKAGAFWSKPPSATSLTVLVGVNPMCVKDAATCDAAGFTAAYKQPGNQVAPTDLSDGTAKFDCSVTWHGPWFECSADNPTTKAKFQLKGVMLGREVGDRFFFYLEGHPETVNYSDMAVVGEGVIEAVDVGGGTTKLTFRGVAAATPHVDKDGHCCLAKSPLLQSHDDKPGIMTLSN